MSADSVRGRNRTWARSRSTRPPAAQTVLPQVIDQCHLPSSLDIFHFSGWPFLLLIAGAASRGRPYRSGRSRIAVTALQHRHAGRHDLRHRVNLGHYPRLSGKLRLQFRDLGILPLHLCVERLNGGEGDAGDISEVDVRVVRTVEFERGVEILRHRPDMPPGQIALEVPGRDWQSAHQFEDRFAVDGGDMGLASVDRENFRFSVQEFAKCLLVVPPLGGIPPEGGTTNVTAESRYIFG